MKPPIPIAPTRARFILMLWLCALAVVFYLDRYCFAKAIPAMQKELDLSKSEIGYILMAFTLAYGLFEIPTGRLGDRFGSRGILVRIVLWWSAFTALTGIAWGFASMLAIRFLFGMGEAGAYPNAARVIARWFPLSERGRVQGAMLTAAQLGAMLAPIAAAYLIDWVGWRVAFSMFGLLGVVWAAGFWLWFRDNPASHPRVNAAELAVIHAGEPPPAPPEHVPWLALFTNRGVLGLGVIQILMAFFSYLFYNWFPTYLEEGRGVDNLESGWLSSLAVSGGMIGVFLGGFLADAITAHAAEPARTRRNISALCSLGAAGFLFAAVRCDSTVALAALCGVAFMLMHVTLPNWWSYVIPQGGRHVGLTFGLVNGMGLVGAAASSGFVGIFADWQKARGLSGRPQWDPLFDIYVVALLVTAVAWLAYRYRPLEPERGYSERGSK